MVHCGARGDIKLELSEYSTFITSDKPYETEFCGTACWVAPELIQKAPYSKPNDVWAFGCVMHEMACGNPPFETIDLDSNDKNFAAILKGGVAP